jgi:hypothetical protein
VTELRGIEQRRRVRVCDGRVLPLASSSRSGVVGAVDGGQGTRECRTLRRSTGGTSAALPIISTRRPCDDKEPKLGRGSRTCKAEG